ncbi:MAG: taurine dioxygenase [Sphingomonadales bacterium RIFCSPHIGHO2_01_FULL_65_20]|uniref:TauD/TfdA dioxygenase family protein n=1 Tax=Blastomonas sp. TaxID=1909299 RepID=UPI0008ADC385|nr:TauD/TfdA family dioxygenase [Blastomonas sp.]MCH2238324.1 TauD/TfdA family dioxygenase [Blastomonas sp.]OHC95176.1 MAG: taurine dioxygenase [Sphingomonadales bacterium RIFCSPHIGHO2_01_FULL_65_20]
MSDLINSFINAADPQSPLDIVPVAGRIGAEVRGLALSGDLDDASIEAIKTALVRHKVLFFRDQAELDDARHEAFAARLGEPIAHPTVPVAEGSHYLLELDTKEGYAASSWHTDVTFVDAYPEASILRAITIPQAGGDTLWANGVTAYEELPEALKTLVDGLWAVHSNKYDYAAVLGTKDAKRAEEHSKVFASTVYETEHPVVRVHPVSGERSLLLGHFVKQFVGLNSADSQRLFSILQDHITKPENTVRWRWRAGDVAIWDNRATQHRAIADFGLQRRTLRRATIAGDIPVAIDGRRSRTVKKERAVELEPAE